MSDVLFRYVEVIPWSLVVPREVAPPASSSCVLVAILCFVVALPHYIRYFPPRRSCRTTNEATNIIDDIIINYLTLPSFVVVAVVVPYLKSGW